jgi:uncharacterized integral membrane protein
MRWFYFIVLLIVAAAVAVFAIQNQDTVTIQFLDWSVSHSLAIIVGVVYLAGMISGWTVLGIIRRSLRHATREPAR